MMGSITFGPLPTKEDVQRIYDRVHLRQSIAASSTICAPAQACSCIGPQLGQTKCPCMLRGEMEQANAMLRDGVVISGKRYRLVPDETNQ